MGKLHFVAFVVDVAAFFVTGICGMILWNWYVPLVFETAPELTFTLAIGLALVAGVFISSGKSYDPEDFADGNPVGVVKCIFDAIIKDIAKPITLVGIGWIVHFYV